MIFINILKKYIHGRVSQGCKVNMRHLLTLTSRGSILLGLSSVSFTPFLWNTTRPYRTPPRARAIACSCVSLRLPSRGAFCAGVLERETSFCERSTSSRITEADGSCPECQLFAALGPSERRQPRPAFPCAFTMPLLTAENSSQDAKKKRPWEGIDPAHQARVHD